MIYSKKRRKPAKEKRNLTRVLLSHLKKINSILSEVEKTKKLSLTTKYISKRKILEKIYEQQFEMFETGISCKNRILSLSKSYVRPIVRGKERKQVEFGAKVNKIQIDRINFIEKVSYRNFNEGCNYQSSIEKAEILTGERVKLTGADNIYATNKNRKYASSRGIVTDFKRKGRAGKNESSRKMLSKAIRKERSTSLEGSFGTEKSYYLLNKIKARRKDTEILWIFFGIHTKNALEIGRRKYKSNKIKNKQVAA